MAALISKDIQLLLDQAKHAGMTVSCYADTSVSERFDRHWLQPFKTEASRIRQQLADDHQARAEFERNVEVIRKCLESSKARGMAVFSAAARGFFLAVPAELPYENRLVVSEEPYVVPLLEADFRRRGYLVMMADTHRARWYAAGPGGSRSLGEIDESVPKKQHSAGERWGKQQATIERHRKDHILHFHKELAQRVEEAWDQYPYQGIVLLGHARSWNSSAVCYRRGCRHGSCTRHPMHGPQTRPRSTKKSVRCSRRPRPTRKAMFWRTSIAVSTRRLRWQPVRRK